MLEDCELLAAALVTAASLTLVALSPAAELGSSSRVQLCKRAELAAATAAAILLTWAWIVSNVSCDGETEVTLARRRDG